MYKNRIVITSLEEDLQNIGLLARSSNRKTQKPLTEWMEEGEDEENHPPMGDDEEGAEDDDHSEMGSEEAPSEDDGEEGMEGGEEGGDETSDQEQDPDADSDGMDDSVEHDDDQEDMDDDHMPEKHPMPPQKFSPLKMGESKSSLSRVNTLLEEVQSLVNNVNTVQRREALKSFAEIAMTSEMLSRGYVKLAKALAEQDLRGVAHTYRALAEEAGRVALELKSNKPIKHLDETFKGHVNILLQGLDLFEDIVEACDDAMKSHEDSDEDEDEKSHHPHHPHIDIQGDNDEEDEKEAEESDEKDEDLY